MLSVLTLTYQRHKILEEAIQSYLNQEYDSSEMVIINDSPSVKYVYDHPRIKIHNLNKRFTSIGKKLEYGFSVCDGDYIYRLDDDDLLTPNGLLLTQKCITETPGYEVYHPERMHIFYNNKYTGTGSNVNTGNVYLKSSIINRVVPDKSFGEDVDITFNSGLNVYRADNIHTMIYRWGSNTYHISGFGEVSLEKSYAAVDRFIATPETGTIYLHPHFEADYYSLLT